MNWLSLIAFNYAIMETLTSCNVASLSPYVPNAGNPWDVTKAKHVYRRLDFGTSDANINIALNTSPQNAVDQIIDNAIALPNTPTPVWGFWNINDYTDYQNQANEQTTDWYRITAQQIQNTGLKGRLSFFWLNHFVTQKETYFYPPYTFRYWNTLQTHALGNFRDFVRAIGTDPAMLIYLNGFENTNIEPNENYARELYELFTLGQDNGYTQVDIEQTAKALTGYNHWSVPGDTIFFDESTFDPSDKIIFEQEGNWDYDDVIDILFEQRSALIAPYICRKLYTFFISRDVNEDVVTAMAETLLANDFELVPVYRLLFKSEHFFDIDANELIIKSPYDITYTYLNELGFQYDDSDFGTTDLIIYGNSILGQDMYDPVDVAGWQRDRDWINSSTITGRWLIMELITWPAWNYDQDQFRQFAINLTNNSNDPAVITEQIIHFFITRPLHTPMDYEVATGILRWEVPDNYYDDGLWNLSWDSAPYQVLLLMHHIFRMPEFQLK